MAVGLHGTSGREDEADGLCDGVRNAMGAENFTGKRLGCKGSEFGHVSRFRRVRMDLEAE